MKWGLGERLFAAHLLVAALVVGTLLFGFSTNGTFPVPVLAALAFIGSAGLYFSHSVTKSIRELQVAARKLAAGQPRGRLLRKGPDELEDVARSLEQLSILLTNQINEVTSERDLREAVLAGMEDAILVLRPDATLLLYNQAAKQLFGLYDKAEEQPLFEFIRFPAILDAVYDATRGRPAPIDLVIPGPPRREVVGRATPLPRGGEAAVVVAVRDVTELRRLEAMRRDFVSSASHELRTPVSVIRGYAETLASGALDDREAAERFVSGLSRQAERLSLLIEDLLDLTKVESGKLHFSPTVLHLGEALYAIIEEHRAAAEAKDLTIEMEPADLRVFIDQKALEMIVGNLLENSIKYTPEGGMVRISAERDGAIVRIDVEDSGPGIEPHHLPRIFERFYRVDSGRAREVGGTGLGLSIAKHVAQQSGGELGVESRPGKGSKFTLRLAAPASES